MIADVAGKDATKDFEDFGHSSDAKQTLKQFKIGELVEVGYKSTVFSGAYFKQ